MTSEIPEESEAVIAEPSMNTPGSNAHLQSNMRVLGTHGKVLGKVETLEHDAATGQLATLVVRHGWLNNKRTVVSANRVKWVNADSVILDLTPSAFRQLPRSAMM
jgi:sporulation protein YlmC with PRC-barrel domain